MSISRPSSQSPELRVSAPRAFQGGAGAQVELAKEAVEALRGPGDALNLMSGKKFRMIRAELDASTPYTGLHAERGAVPRAIDVPNPDSPDGQWDPYAYMPRFVFEAGEDAFPVPPNFDGDTDLANNGPTAANAGDGHYQDGVVGGRQPLTGAFTVTKKGEYHILTYSFYYAHNKAGDYHQNDYSTAQVYLKPGKDGKLAPTHLMTSWHHGAILTPWQDLGKDDQGRPMVKVQLGSHALQVLGKDEKPPTKGLQIQGDGQAVLDGRPVDQKLAFEAFQTNVKDARYLDPGQAEALPRLEAMRWGEAAVNPFLPSVFEEATPVWQEMAKRGLDSVEKGLGEVKDGLEKGLGEVKDGLEKGLGEVKDGAGKLWGKVKGLF